MPSVVDAMNTAVPDTRGSGVSAMSARNSSSGIVPVSIIFDSSNRPRHHVVMIANAMMPPASGNQPPAAILIRFDEKNAPSITTSGTYSASAAPSDQPQLRRQTRKIRYD